MWNVGLWEMQYEILNHELIEMDQWELNYVLMEIWEMGNYLFEYGNGLLEYVD